MNISNNKQAFKIIDELVNNWCDRRCLKALRFILQGWPLVSGLTDEWGQLLDELEHIRIYAKDEITKDELAKVNSLIAIITKTFYNR